MERRRPLKAMMWIGVALVAVNVVLATVLAVAPPASWARPGATALVLLLSVAVSALLLWAMHRLHLALESALDRSDATVRRLAEILDTLEAAVVLYDRDDRIELMNRDFRRVYEGALGAVRIGDSFESMLRSALASGVVPEARDDPEGWIGRRLASHRAAGGTLLRELSGGRWRQIIERRLGDGSLLAHSFDVTEMVHQGRALAAARAEAEATRQRLLDAIEALPAGFELYDADDRLVLSNRMMASLYPAVADLIDQRPTFEQLVRANHERGGLPRLPDAAALQDWLDRRQAQRRNPQEPFVLTMADGRSMRIYERRMGDGGLVAIRVDISELEAQKAQAEQAIQRLHDAIEALPDAFALFDADDRLVVFNTRYRDLYKESSGAMVPGTTFEDGLRYGLARGQYPQAVGREDDWLAERLRMHADPSGPFLQELPGNRWMRIDERRTRDGGMAGVRTDVTQLVRHEQDLQRANARLDALNAELARLSETDALTGLANRRLFDRRLADEWLRARRHDLPLALLVIDVDHFKRYNDHHGHPEGDQCLRRVAAVLRDCARRPADLAARMGGEEFALLLPHQSRVEACALAQQCLKAVRAAALPHGDSPDCEHVTVSIGVAVIEPAITPGEASVLVAAADAALYAAKQAGRNQMQVAPG